MIENACYTREGLVGLIIPLFVIVGISWIFYFFSKNKKFVNLSTIILLVFGLSTLLLNFWIESKIREEIRQKFESDEIQSILINDVQSEIGLNVLKKSFSKIEKTDFVRGSSPTKRFEIAILYQDSKFTFTLFRNSYEPTKYHVETNLYNYELDVGMIRTDLLDEI